MVLLLFSSFPLDGVLADAVEDKIESKGYQEEEIMEVHQDLERILKKSSGFFIDDMGRTLGMGAISLLAWLLEFFERGVNGIIGLGNFYSTSGVKDTIDNLMPFILGLFLITLIIVGILLMLNKIEKRENLVINILLAISMLVIIPNIFPLLDRALSDGVGHIVSEKSLADTVIEHNVADLQLFVDADFKYSGKGGSLPNPSEVDNYSALNKVDGLKFSPYQKFDMYEGERSFWFDDKEFQKNHPNAYNVLVTRTDYDGDGDGTSLRLLRKNIFPGTEFGREEYYRYAVNWGTIIITLFILTLATAITVVKMGRVVFDIAFHSIFGLFVAVTDVTGGQRIKKMITEIVSSFAVFFVMVLILRLFILYANWLLNVKDTIGTVSYILMLLGGAWALLDAPDIVQRLLGIDAGLRSAWGTMAGAYGLAKGAQGVGKGISKGIEGVAKGATGAGAYARRALGMQPKGGGSSRMQKSPVNANFSGGGGNPPNPPSGGGGGDDGNPPNPPGGGGGGRGGNPPNPPGGGGGFVSPLDESVSPLSSPLDDGMKEDTLFSGDPKKNMRFNLDAPNEPLSSGGSKGNSGKRNSSDARKFNLDAPNNPITGSSGGVGGSGSGGGTFSTNQPNFSTGIEGVSGGGSGSGGSSVLGGSFSGSGGSPSADGGSMFSGSHGGGMESPIQTPNFVSPTADGRNEFYKPTIFGGSRLGQEVAVNKAKSYNSGLKMRQNISKAMNTGRQFKNFTIASTKHSLGMNPSRKKINEE